MSTCADCRRRTWLLSRLAGHLEKQRAHIQELLSLGDRDLISAVGGAARGEIEREWERFGRRGSSESDPRARARLTALCRHDPAYPPALLDSRAPPAILHLAGDSERLKAVSELASVALIGSRRASGYGLEVARALGRGLAASGLPVISGMAGGVDSAAHAGALEAGGLTIAVLPAGADRPYPAAKRRLYGQIRTTGLTISELGPGSGVWRWAFPARNRIIAALATATVVVEAGEGSGALLTAEVAQNLERPLGAVPGSVTSSLASGPNALIAGGAALVRDPQDVLDLLFGAGVRQAHRIERPPVNGGAAELLSVLSHGVELPLALERCGFDAAAGLAALAELELGGYVRRTPGGRYTVLA